MWHRFLLVGALTLGAPAPAIAEVIDGVVAAIDYKPIALSILEAYRRAFWPQQPAAVALDRLIDDRLLAAEARRYGQTLSDSALAEGLARWPKPAGLLEAEWRQVVADHVQARQFLTFRFADFVPISREELRAYYAAHRGEFQRPFEEVEPLIRERLTPAVRARREQAFKQELRSRSQVRLTPELLPAD